MLEYIPSLQKLIEQLRHIPSTGKKTAVRMAFSILDFSEEEAAALAEAILEVKKTITQCPVCCNIAEGGLCDICADENREKTIICVVEDYRAVMSLERVREYRGLYHVLHGVLSPINGIGPDKIRIAELILRLDNNPSISEIIIATNPNVEGEATALFLTKLLRPRGIKTSRLAYGMPVGGDLEYTDEGTLTRAIEGRREIQL